MDPNKVMATKLPTKTMQCAALCMLEANKNPVELPTRPLRLLAVPSGLHVLDKQDCASGIQAAIEASYRRLKELVEVTN